MSEAIRGESITMFTLQTKPYPVKVWCLIAGDESDVDTVQDAVIDYLAPLAIMPIKELKHKIYDPYRDWRDPMMIEFEDCTYGVLLHFPEVPKTLHQLAAVSHEFLHVVNFVGRIIGMEHNSKTEEAFAYLMDNLLDEFYQNIGLEFTTNIHKTH